MKLTTLILVLFFGTLAKAECQPVSDNVDRCYAEVRKLITGVNQCSIIQVAAMWEGTFTYSYVSLRNIWLEKGGSIIDGSFDKSIEKRSETVLTIRTIMGREKARTHCSHLRDQALGMVWDKDELKREIDRFMGN